jgi:Chromo (CHRromatin Organisation MOdifier) domain
MLTTADLALQLPKDARKLVARYTGPFEVLEVVSPVAYKLDLPSHMRVHPVFHVSTLKPYLDPGQTNPQRRVPAPEIVMTDSGPEHEVELVLAKRERRVGRGLRIEYLIKWKHMPESENTWEPLRHLTNAQDAIQEFESLAQNQI